VFSEKLFPEQISTVGGKARKGCSPSRDGGYRKKLFKRHVASFDPEVFATIGIDGNTTRVVDNSSGILRQCRKVR
jgi:hypothetical protein